MRDHRPNQIVAITGSCFCGTIKYKIDGKLRDARSCHCSMCRKAFSAQASAYALVNPEEFLWVIGDNLLTKYESKNGAGLLFCSICGSTLCGTYKGKVHGVTLGCVDGDPEIKIERHKSARGQVLIFAVLASERSSSASAKGRNPG